LRGVPQTRSYCFENVSDKQTLSNTMIERRPRRCGEYGTIRFSSSAPDETKRLRYYNIIRVLQIFKNVFLQRTMTMGSLKRYCPCTAIKGIHRAIEK